MSNNNFTYGQPVVLYDEISDIAGMQQVAYIESWVLKERYKGDKKIDISQTSGKYLYFVKTYNGKILGPFIEEELRKL